MIDLKKPLHAVKTEGFDALVRKSTEMLPYLEKELEINMREKQKTDAKIESITKQITAIKKFLAVTGSTTQRRGRKKNITFEKDSDGLIPTTGKTLMELIYQILKEHGSLHNRDILNYLREKGYKVAGSNPVTNYFSHLSRDKRITGTGKRGEYMINPEYQVNSDAV